MIRDNQLFKASICNARFDFQIPNCFIEWTWLVQILLKVFHLLNQLIDGLLCLVNLLD